MTGHDKTLPRKSAPRMRLLRERRRDGAQLITIELSRTGIDLLIKGGWLGTRQEQNRDNITEAFIDLMLAAFDRVRQGRL